jgi:hypothetical protein
VLRKKIRDAGYAGVTVVNKAISDLADSFDVVVSHQDLADRAAQRTPSAVHVAVDNFMASPRYDEPVDWNGKPAEFVIGVAAAGDDHLALLSRIAGIFTDSAQVAALRAASTPEEVAAVIDAVKV